MGTNTGSFNRIRNSCAKKHFRCRSVAALFPLTRVLTAHPRAELLAGPSSGFIDIIWMIISRIYLGEDGVSNLLTLCQLVVGSDVKDLSGAFSDGTALLSAFSIIICVMCLKHRVCVRCAAADGVSRRVPSFCWRPWTRLCPRRALFRPTFFRLLCFLIISCCVSDCGPRVWRGKHPATH